MLESPKILLVGGVYRNVGKTHLTCRLIKKFSKKHEIIGLKIKPVYPNDSNFHGRDNAWEGDYCIIRESEPKGESDTASMFKAGAKCTYRIKSRVEHLKKAIDDFLKIVEKDRLIICESNSLRLVLKPSLYLMIQADGNNRIKPSALKLMKYVDVFVNSDGENHDIDIDKVLFDGEKWQFLNN